MLVCYVRSCARAHAAPYATNAVNTTTCAAGYSKIGDEPACEAAAKAVGKSYGGNVTDASSPPGCFLRVDSGKVLLNLDRAGAADPLGQPLCAREYTAARLTAPEGAPAERRGTPVRV